MPQLPREREAGESLTHNNIVRADRWVETDEYGKHGLISRIGIDGVGVHILLRSHAPPRAAFL
eukprot:1166-Eustigmatos_ZCMA.PRE.1